MQSPLYQLLNETMKARFREGELWRQTMNNPNLRLCPNEVCKEGIVDMSLNPPQCRRCRRTFCRNCMMDVHRGSCDGNFDRHFRDFRKCPSCGISIQKIDGCNHIVCFCSYQFCLSLILFKNINIGHNF